MRLKKIKIKNFLSFNEAEIDFEKYTKTLILGVNSGDNTNSNGSGKTNLFEAIGWVVWGKSKARVQDDNIKYGENSCIVELYFEHDNKQCSIKRSRKDGLMLIDFLIDGEPSNGDSAPATTKKIIEFLKMDYLTYINSVYLRQDDIFSLANPEKSNDGRDILESFLELDIYDSYEKTCKNDIDNIKKEIQQNIFYIDSNRDCENLLKKENEFLDFQKKELSIVESNIVNFENVIISMEKEYSSMKENASLFKEISYNISMISTNIETKKKELDSTKDNGREMIAIRNKKKEDLSLKISKKSDIEKEKNDYVDILKKNESLVFKLNQLNESISSNKINLKLIQEKYNNADKQQHLLESKISELKKEIKILNDNLDNFSINIGDKCDICMSDIKDNNLDLIKKHRINIMNEKITKLEPLEKSLSEVLPQKLSLKKEISIVEDNISKFENGISDLKDKIISEKQANYNIKQFDDKLFQIENYVAELNNLSENSTISFLKAKIVKLESEIENDNKSLESLNNQLSNVKINLNDVDKLEKSLVSNRKSLEDKNKNKYLLLSNINNSDKKISAFDIIYSKYNDSLELDVRLNKKLTLLQQIEKALSSQGVRAKILENAILELEKEANILLQRISGGRLSLEFRTKKEVLKTNLEKVVFEVMISDGVKTLPFSSYSGGEKFRIAFVLRIALSKILLRKAKSKIEFLIIDEAVSPLDQDGVDNVMSVINELQNDFKNILVITHRNDIKNMFDEVITIYRDENGSRIAS